MGLRKGPGQTGSAKDLGFAQATRFAKMALCRIYGLTYEEMAPLIGTTKNQIRKWFNEQKEFFADFDPFVKSVMPALSLDDASPEIGDKEAYIAAMTQRLGRLVPVLERALASHDVRLALDAAKELHKVVGIGQKISVEHSGKVNHDHQHKVVPAGLLTAVNGPRERRGLPPLKMEATRVDNDGASAS